MGIVYLIRNTKNNKVYIGKTVTTFESRYPGGQWWIHTHNIHLKRAADKYGHESFTVEVLFESDSELELLKFEAVNIDEHKALNKSYGYNKVLDAMHSEHVTTETLVQNKVNWHSLLKERYSDTEYVERWKASIKNAYDSNPELAALSSKRFKIMHQDPDFRERNLILLESNRSNPSWKQKVKDGIRKYHETNKEEFAIINAKAWSEERRRKQSERSRRNMESAEAREHQRNSRLEYLSNPDNKAKAVENLRKGLDTCKAKARVACINRNSDPLFQRRAHAIRIENLNRKRFGLPKLTKEEKIEFLAKRGI